MVGLRANTLTPPAGVNAGFPPVETACLLGLTWNHAVDELQFLDVPLVYGAAVLLLFHQLRWNVWTWNQSHLQRSGSSSGPAMTCSKATWSFYLHL